MHTSIFVLCQYPRSSTTLIVAKDHNDRLRSVLLLSDWIGKSLLHNTRIPDRAIEFLVYLSNSSYRVLYLFRSLRSILRSEGGSEEEHLKSVNSALARLENHALP